MAQELVLLMHLKVAVRMVPGRQETTRPAPSAPEKMNLATPKAAVVRQISSYFI